MKLAKSAPVPSDRLLTALGELAQNASFEVAPRYIAAQRPLGSLLEPGTRVYVPFLPRADWADTIAACRALAAQGFDAVPHVPARMAASRGQFRDCLAALRSAGVNALLLIAGDRSAPAGPFGDTLQVLESGLLEAHGFKRLAVAGHPEGHPQVDEGQLDHALRSKLEYARATGTEMWIVSQFAFGSAQVIAWLERLRGKGFRIPVDVGVPGPASLKTVLSYAAQCGVEASARALARRPGAARLLGRWTPEGQLRDLARYRLAHPDSLLRGIHLYTFGGLEATAQWLKELDPRSGEVESTRSSGAI